MMQALGRRYVQYFNYTYERTGTLWEGRYKSTIVDSERYLLTVYRYIELNPVRAGMVDHASDYPWSSYHQNAGEKDIELLSPHNEYLKLGSSKKSRKRAYRLLFQGLMKNSEIEYIRDATNRSWVLGGENFKRDFELRTQLCAQPKPRAGDRKSKGWN